MKKARSPVMPKLNFETQQESTKKEYSFPTSIKKFTSSIKRGCEWPKVIDETDFHFCGKERFEDKPYCLNTL